MPFSNPSVADFKAQFARAFPFGGNDPDNPDLKKVSDVDIANAFVGANGLINCDLFGNQSAYANGYLLLAAHSLVLTLRASSGVGGGGFTGFQTSKSVGSVSASYGIPQKLLDNPYFALLCSTPFGAQYLGLIYPLLAGAIFSVPGATHS